MVEPTWIRRDVVLAIHKRQLAEHGGLEGVRDEGLLASALARPRNLFAYSAGKAGSPALAAACAFGIIRNHPFLDGNKRTAFVVARAFLLLHGVDLDADREEKLVTFLELADGELSEEALAAWMRERATVV